MNRELFRPSLALLDQWLESPSQVCALHGAAGSGKTQLLEAWTSTVREHGQWTVVTLFISRERGTWLARDWVPELQVLLEQAGLGCSPPQNCNWRQLLFSIGFQLADKTFNEGRPTLLVVDGLFDSPSRLPEGVFPQTFAPELKLVFSCERANDALLVLPLGAVVIRLPEWEALSRPIGGEGTGSQAVEAVSRAHFHSAFEAVMMRDLAAQGLVDLAPDLTPSENIWQRVFLRASRATRELLSLLANCLVPLTETDLVDLVDEEHRIALRTDPVVALLTKHVSRGVVLRHELLHGVIAEAVGLDWGIARLYERCAAKFDAWPSGYAFIYGVYHSARAERSDELSALLDPERQRKWQRTTPVLYWAWADESRLIGTRLIERLIETTGSCSIEAIVRAVLQTATVHELSEAVVSGRAEEPEPIDDRDVLAIVLAKLSRFAEYPYSHDVAQWAIEASGGRAPTMVEVSLTLPSYLRGTSLIDSLATLRSDLDAQSTDAGGFELALRAVCELFRNNEETHAIENLRWIYEKHRNSGFVDLRVSQVELCPKRAKRQLNDWAQQDAAQTIELEAALLDGMQQEVARDSALRILALRAHQKVSVRAARSAVRHLPEAALRQLSEQLDSPLAADVATRYMSLGLRDSALDVMARAPSHRDAVAAALVLGASPGDPWCKEILRSLEPGELARLVEGTAGSGLMARHGVQKVFAWANELAFAPRCLVALVRGAVEHPPSWAIDALTSLVERSTNAGELHCWLALGPWSRAPEAPAWVVDALTVERARQYLGRLMEPLLEASGRRFTLDDDPHVDLMDLMPLIRRIEGERGVVEVARALRQFASVQGYGGVKNPEQ